MNKLAYQIWSFVFLAQEKSTGIDTPEFQRVGRDFFNFATSTPGAARTAGDLLVSIINILLFVAAAIAVIFLIVGGFQYITARGNEEATEKAKKTITGSVIGIVVIILAFAIVAIVNNLLTQGQGAGGGGGGTGGGAGGETQQIQISIQGQAVYQEEDLVNINFSASPSGRYTWRLDGSLPGGLTFDASTATLSGPTGPDSAGTYTLTITATNAVGQSASRQFQLIVKGKEAGVPSPGPSEALKITAPNQSFSCPLNDYCEIAVGTISGGKTPYKLHTTKNLPPGLGAFVSLNTIVVSGSANQAKSSVRDVEIVVADSSSPAAQQKILIGVEVK